MRANSRWDLIRAFKG